MAERHRVDLIALTAGLLSLAVSALVLLARADAMEVDGLVVLATVWLVLGVVGLGSAARRVVRRTDDGDVA